MLWHLLKKKKNHDVSGTLNPVCRVIGTPAVYRLPATISTSSAEVYWQALVKAAVLVDHVVVHLSQGQQLNSSDQR